MTGCYVGCVPPRLGVPVSLPTPTTVPVHIVHSVGQLPFTGSDVLGLLLMGVAAVTIGLAIVRNRRLFD